MWRLVFMQEELARTAIDYPDAAWRRPHLDAVKQQIEAAKYTPLKSEGPAEAFVGHSDNGRVAGHPSGRPFRMFDETLDAYIRQLIEGHRTPQVTVAWQGGEPTLMGLDFFRKAIELQERYR